METLSDGLLHVKVKSSSDGTEKEYAIDLLALRLACEECENSHHLEVKDGKLMPTLNFLADLAARLGMFIPECSVSVAFQLWGQSVREIEFLKKNTSETLNLPTGSTSSPEV